MFLFAATMRIPEARIWNLTGMNSGFARRYLWLCDPEAW